MYVAGVGRRNLTTHMVRRRRRSREDGGGPGSDPASDKHRRYRRVTAGEKDSRDDEWEQGSPAKGDRARRARARSLRWGSAAPPQRRLRVLLLPALAKHLTLWGNLPVPPHPLAYAGAREKARPGAWGGGEGSARAGVAPKILKREFFEAPSG
jgi:hypothetical protein